MPDTKTMDFEPPLEIKGKGDVVRKIASLELREPTAREVRDSEAIYNKSAGPVADRQRDTALLAAVADTDADVIRVMPASIFNAGVRFVRDFITAAPEADYSKDRPSELVVTLDEAIEQSGQRWDAFTLREPTTGDAEAAEQEMSAAMNSETLRRFQIVLVSRVSGAPRFIVERLPIRKLDEAARYLGGFISAGRRAGLT